MEKVPVPPAPVRLINAVARMGYATEVALCDLMDNSIDAGAANISVELIRETHEEEGRSDTIGEYVIADDGSGMDRDTLIYAFTLGTPREYPEHALGKFGIGLKSAGLSISDKITIITKMHVSQEVLCAVLSIADIEASGEYEIDLGVAEGNQLEVWEKYAPNQDQGTIVILSDLTEGQPAFSSFVDYFRRYCSVIYHKFMENEPNPLQIEINSKKIPPRDPLFISEASENGPLSNPEDWDGRSVRLLLEESPLPLSNGVSCQIAATHLVHPPSFEEEGRRDEVRDQYMIETDPYTRRPRHGFYIYRNRRAIVLAERFHGLVPAQTQAWAFRGRLMFDEAADKILSLDVRKRRAQLPTAARNNLRSMIRNYTALSAEAWRGAGKRVQERRRETKEDFANEGLAKSPVINLGYTPGAVLDSPDEVATRQEKLGEFEKTSVESIQDAGVTSDVLAKKAADKSSVILTQGLRANAMWLSHPAPNAGMAQTLINMNHSWIAAAYAEAEDDARITVLLHHLFTILARAELEVRSTNWKDLSEDAIVKTFTRFHSRISLIGEDLAPFLEDELGRLSERDFSGEE